MPPPPRVYLRKFEGICSFCHIVKDDVFGVMDVESEHRSRPKRRLIVCAGCAPAVRDISAALVEVSESDAPLSPEALKAITTSTTQKTKPPPKPSGDQ